MTEQLSSTHFIERSGIGVVEDVEMLMNPPENPLDEHEKVEVLEFASQLIDGALPYKHVETDKTLVEIYKQNATRNQHTFYLDFFLDPENETVSELLQAWGYEGDRDSEKLKELFVTSPVFNQMNLKERTEIAKASLDYTKSSMSQNLLTDPEGQTDQSFKEMDSITCHYQPEELLEKFHNLQAYRRFYKEIHKDLKPYEGRVPDAKRAVLDLHRAKVNSLLAELYPAILKLKDQLPYMDPAEAESLVGHIDMPAVERLMTSDQQNIEENFYRRLDYLRNGTMVQKQEDGSLTMSPISQELQQLFEEQAQDNSPNGTPQFNEAEMDKMATTVWAAPDLEKLIEDVLGEWGELSEEKATWDVVKARDGKAADGKYQVIITPETDSLSVDTKKFVVKIPEKFSRTLTQNSPAGALLVAAHELAHVAQSLVDRELARTIPLAEIKGRHVLTVREAGGLHQEVTIHEKYLGGKRMIAPHYLSALQAKLGGANRMQASRAFYNSYLAQEQIPETDEKGHKKAAAQAVDRTLRLYRNGGANTQPLDYAEQGLIIQALKKLDPDQAAAFVIASGSFDIKDTVKLHAFGLVSKLETPHKPAEDVMRIYREKYSSILYTSE